VFYAIVSQGNQQHTDCLDVARARAGWLLNVAVELPLPNRGADDATKTPDLVTAKIRDKNFVAVLICLVEWLPKSTDPRTDLDSQAGHGPRVGEQRLDGI